MDKAEYNKKVAKTLAERSNDLLLGHNFAQRQLGYIHSLDLEYGEPIPLRTLLEVEQAAEKKRQEKTSEQLKYNTKVSTHLHQLIDKAIKKQLEDIDYIYDEVIGIQGAVPTMLDILATRAASVGRLEPLINDLPWLGRELVKLVNLPHYRKQRSKGRAVTVDNPQLAIRYLGLENLGFVIPTFAMRHWMPHSTEPFTLLKRKLRDCAMSVAIAAQTLAKHHGVNEYHAFTIGIFFELGKVALSRLYIRTFESIWQHKVKQARDALNKDLHTALIELKPDPLFLRNLLVEQSLPLTRKLAEKMEFKYLPFNHLFNELDEQPDLHQRSKLSQVISKAQCYTQYDMLHSHQLIEDDEKEIWFDYIGLTEEEERLLSSTNLSNISLQIED